MPGSTNPWASELKARKTSGTRRPKTGNPEGSPDPEILLNKDKTRETETNRAALAEPPQIETRGGEQAIGEKVNKDDSAEKVTPERKSVKEVKKTVTEVKNPKAETEVKNPTAEPEIKTPKAETNVKNPKAETEVKNPKVETVAKNQKVEMNKRSEEPRKAAAPVPPPPKTKVKTLPVEVEDGKGSLYQDARSHLKRVVTRQISRSKDENKIEDDEEDLTPIDRLIRQGSFEPTTTNNNNNVVEKDSAKGRFLEL